MVLAAEYTNKTKRQLSELVIRPIANGERLPEVAVYRGVTRTEARKLATECGATPWNF